MTTAKWSLSVRLFAGYLADKYDVDAEAAVPRADERLSQSALAILEDTVDNHQRRTFEDGVVHKDEGTVEYAMAPVWILTTRYDGKPYTFMMNGQTGKMAGSLPMTRPSPMNTVRPWPLSWCRSCISWRNSS